jgi:membrane protein YdbS with pleckstrin-like domain
VDDVEKMGTYRSHQVRIAVPEAERDRAVHILADMEQKEAARLSPLVRVANHIIGALVVALAIIATVGLVDRGGKWFIAASSLLTLLAAAFLIRQAWPLKRGPGGK